MTALAHDPTEAELEPVRRALLSRAREDASGELARAEADSTARLAAARAQAVSLRDTARKQGDVDAALQLAADLARARRQARAMVLRAQREAYDELSRRSRDAVRALLADPAHRGLLARMGEAIRQQVDAEAVIREDPRGGLCADAAGRYVDLSLDALTDQAMRALGGEVAGLWSP